MATRLTYSFSTVTDTLGRSHTNPPANGYERFLYGYVTPLDKKESEKAARETALSGEI